MALMTAIGMMSGTSMDGIDVALIRTDGEGIVEAGPSASARYGDSDRSLLRRALADATKMNTRADTFASIDEAERLVTKRHAALLRDFLAAEHLGQGSIDVVGFHGQTILHRPEERLTVQIGDGDALANAVGIPVVFDMRGADVAAGGQGAPLVPAYHRALVAASQLPRPVAVLNLGGVGNVTFVGEDRDPIAFDTGPGNALIDDIVQERTGSAMDQDGRLGLAGTVDEAALATLLDHPYFARAVPKSLDRNAFSRGAVSGLRLEDAVATLVAFTARTAARARDFLPAVPAIWVVCGGGARNPAVMAALSSEVGVPVVTADEVGWSSAMMEAQAFAYLAVRSLKGLPLTFPSTTGVGAPMTGGVLARPAAAMRRA